MSRFAELFGVAPAAVARAPGRVNLIGDHTDYNDGFVMPTAIPQETVVEIGIGNGGHEAYSVTLDRHVRFDEGALPDFARYIGGCVRVIEARGHSVPPLRLRIASEVPVGAGLSSSAALEVATLRALDQLMTLNLDPMEIASLAWEAETRHAGVSCGVMDQIACSLATPSRMLFLDTKTLERELIPLPDGAEVLVVDSGVPRALADSKYNERRAECQAAAAALGVPSLRTVTSAKSADDLPSPLRERAKHVISENERVLAARNEDAATFGALMNASHASLRDDYQVSVPEVDALVAALQAEPEVYGARMTGAGFGGACVALVNKGTARAVGARISAREIPGARLSVVVPIADAA
jgi:galactokinase